jgi:hypothetical protein
MLMRRVTGDDVTTWVVLLMWRRFRILHCSPYEAKKRELIVSEEMVIYEE